MKNFIYLYLLFCTGKFAQNKNPNAIYDCTYSTSFNQLFDQGRRFKTFESELVASQDLSLFYTVPTKETYAGEEEEQDEQNLFFREDTLFKIVKFIDDNRLLFTDRIFTNKEKLYTDTLHPMKWNLENEQKTIDSFQCSKATTHFKGRNYIAWYCPFFSVPNGPWKLGGLPGLIVEAYDEDRNLRFFLKRIRVIPYPPILMGIQKPASYDLIATYEDYIKNGLAFLKKMKDQLNAQSEGNCLDCHSSSRIELHNWENVIH
jgi:GLPGLI family protein